MLVDLARDLGIPLVATNDVHYTAREDASAHDVLLCLQTGTTIGDPKRLRFQTQEFYLKSQEEMAGNFHYLLEALENSVAIAERCHVELTLGETILPHYRVPEGFDAESYLRHLCGEGVARRYREPSPQVTERLEYELSVIVERGLAPYLLIVWDLLHAARGKGILVGPGRGSVAGSVVSYVLDITQIDPLLHGLQFERWLNIERMDMPDIDCDFEDRRRDEMIQYVAETYGKDHVAQIITFGTLGARLAIRDAGRAMQIPLAEVDRVAKMVEPTQSIAEALDAAGDLRRECEDNSVIRELLDTAKAIEGLARHSSTHAAGMVISQEPLTDVVPLQRSQDGLGTTAQFDKHCVEAVGLLKIDLLGLRTLTVLKDAIQLIEASHGVTVELDQIPFDDAKTFELLASAETVGVFQFESAGMRQALKELQPARFGDLVALNALYRPGPMRELPNFVAGRHGRRKITYAHPKLQPILEETYGVIVYQEQVMKIANQFAGFTMVKADHLRGAMAKKKTEVMERLRMDFMSGAAANGISSTVASDVFDRMAVFAHYGFNKSHSAGYAVIAFWTAYLKANYPVEFMAALLTSHMENKDKVAAFFEECRRMGIGVDGPDVNASEEHFSVHDGRIRFGMTAVKHVGANAVQAIVAARQEEGPFRDVVDLCSRVDPTALNRTVLDSLAKAGAFASLPGNRRQQVDTLEHLMEVGQKAYRDRQAGQVSLFETSKESAATTTSTTAVPLATVPEFGRAELLDLEREYLGVYLSEHPLNSVQDQLRDVATATISELGALEPGAEPTFAGLVTNCRKYIAKNKRPMMFLTVEDLTGSVEVTAFSDVYERDCGGIERGSIVVIRGRTESAPAVADEEPETENRGKVLASGLALLSDAAAVTKLQQRSRRSRRGRGAEPTPPPPPISPTRPDPVHIVIPGVEAGSETFDRLRGLIIRDRGNRPVWLHVQEDGGETRMKLGREYAVRATPDFCQAVEDLLGPGAMSTNHTLAKEELNVRDQDLAD
jgi:DNA polymerase-3 subunit alpha